MLARFFWRNCSGIFIVHMYYALTASSVSSYRSTTVRTVYLLIRSKRGASPTARLDTLLQSQLFDTIKSQGNDPVPRVRAMLGDIDQPKLGLSKEDLNILATQVSTSCFATVRFHCTHQVHVVLHCAATVRFDENLSVALSMNVGPLLCPPWSDPSPC